MPPDPSTEGDLLAQRDLVLIQRIQEGDLDAFRELVQTHQQRVAGTIARMVGPGFDYSELAHEVFVRVWKSASRYRPSARFTTWLMTLTRNLVLNEIRYRSRHATVSLDAPQSEETGSPRDLPDFSALGPDAVLQQVELEQAIDRALQDLPENQRTALVLRRYQDLPYEEIAVVLETSVSSVKSLLFRARTQLREALREFLD